MADNPIIEPTVVAFFKKVVRPACDRAVGFNSTMDIEIARYFNDIAPLMANNDATDVIVDGAEEDGRTICTKADFENAMTQFIATQTQYNGPDPGVDESNLTVVIKPSENPENFVFGE